MGSAWACERVGSLGEVRTLSPRHVTPLPVRSSTHPQLRHRQREMGITCDVNWPFQTGSSLETGAEGSSQLERSASLIHGTEATSSEPQLLQARWPKT